MEGQDVVPNGGRQGWFYPSGKGGSPHNRFFYIPWNTLYVGTIKSGPCMGGREVSTGFVLRYRYEMVASGIFFVSIYGYPCMISPVWMVFSHCFFKNRYEMVAFSAMLVPIHEMSCI